MHEWALAEAIIAAASEVADKEELEAVTDVDIRVGEMQQVEPQVLKFALSQLKPARFKEAKFHIRKARTVLSCRACGNRWVLARAKLDVQTSEALHFVPELAHTFIKCPKCGSPDFEIVSGRGVWLAKVSGA